MPNFEYNPNAVSSTIEILDPGEHEFIVGAPKPFLNKNDDGSERNYGIRYSLRTDAGQKTVVSLYLHSDGSIGMTKRFQMAALGYKSSKVDEERFNRDHGNDDWRIDFDNQVAGDGWKQFEGQRVVGIVDVQMNKNTGEPMQNFKSWKPLGA